MYCTVAGRGDLNLQEPEIKIFFPRIFCYEKVLSKKLGRKGVESPGIMIARRGSEGSSMKNGVTWHSREE